MPKQCIGKTSILQVLNFHTSDITSCDFDENFRFASGSSDKKVVVCDWKPEVGFTEVTYSPIAEYKYGVTNVKFIPEEQEFVTSSLDGSISIFNSENGELLHTLMHVNLAGIRTFCCIPEYSMLISAGDDGSICIWDLIRKTMKKSLQIHDETISVTCCSNDSKILLSGDTTGFVKLWHVSSLCENEASNGGTPELCISDCHDLGINQADFSPVSNISDKGKEYKLVTCGNDNLIKIWVITFRKFNETLGHCEYELVFSIVGHASAVTDVKFNFLGNLIASTSLDKTARLWTLEDGNYQCLQVLKGHKRYVTSCCFSRDGSLLATGSNDKTVIIWDLSGNRSLKSNLQRKGSEKFSTNPPSSPFKQKNISKVFQRIENLGNAINSCAFSKNDFLAAGGTDKLVRLWHRSSNVNKFAEISVSPLDFHQYAVNQVDFSLCGTMLASCSVDGTTVIWNLTEYKQIGTVHNTEGGVKCCKFSPDSRLVATAGDNEIVCVWNVNDLQLKANMTGHTDAISSLAFTKDSRYLASGCTGGNLRLWCVTPCTTICLLCEDNVHDLGLNSIDFCLAEYITNSEKDRYLLASGGNDSLVKLWEIVILDELTAKASKIRVLNGHGGDITCVRFPPNSSSIVASTATDKTARIWDLDSGSCLQILDSKESMLTCCSFTFDNTLIATGTLDKALIIWDLRKNEDEFETFALNRLTTKRDNIVKNQLTKNDEKANEYLRYVNAQSNVTFSEFPHEFTCPITQHIMEDPVICADGYTYEKSAIESWFLSGKLTSPMTNKPVPVIKLRPNIELKGKINKYLLELQKD